MQTEAVTYVFQRLASLAALFYLLSLVAYIKSRLSIKAASQYSFYALSLIAAVLAMKTKENAFTLPVVMALYEFFFFTGPVKRRALRLVPLLLTMFIIPLTIIGIDRPAGEIMSGAASIPRGYTGITRLEYLHTQFSVVATYIRLLFLPVGQNIDYDYPVLSSFSEPRVFLSFLLHASILALGVYLSWRSRLKSPALRLIAFGIFWFFIALSVESSVVPLHMLINEYRVYLPSVGAFTAILTCAFFLFGKVTQPKIKTAGAVVLCLVPLVLATATYARNNVWKSGISLWEDTVRKSPLKARAHNKLGLAYRYKGQPDKAIEHYRVAIMLKPDYAEVHNNLGVIYYYNLGQPDKAIEHYKVALKFNPGNARTHLNIGIAYRARGLNAKATHHIEVAKSLNPELFSGKHPPHK